ncbi:hypothetical protein [Pleionea sp. CnH1-48]|uniref:hypothetical protein n=1 Tax=Pleionea sp. CnH1-48 TaxID=2954494 RepID=UPI002096FA43|nr:hypothetical protein [Pleionea sp. CnH1-48]MCO7226367.1 hypothetical protein [Pleionea sp. CnH1-48]
MKHLLYVFSILLILVLGWYFWPDTAPPKSAPADIPDEPINTPVNTQTHSQTTLTPTESIETQPAHSQQPKDTTTSVVDKNCWSADDLDALHLTPEYAVVREWFNDWGMPFPEYFPNSDEVIRDHPYQGYQEETLLELANQSDPLALQTLGMIYRLQAFGQTVPTDMSSIMFSSPDISTEPVDMELFEKSNNYLYRAAIMGKIGALISLSMNYSYLKLWHARHNLLTSTLKAELEKRAYIFGEMPEQLIDGLSQRFFHQQLEEPIKKEYQQALDKMLEQYQKDRTSIGMEPWQSTAPEEYFLLISGEACPEEL